MSIRCRLVCMCLLGSDLVFVSPGTKLLWYIWPARGMKKLIELRKILLSC